MKRIFLLLSILGYTSLCVSMKNNEKIEQNNENIERNNTIEQNSSFQDIYCWKVLLNQTYSIKELEEELEKVTEKEDAKMVYMKMLVHLAQAASTTAQEALYREDEKNKIDSMQLAQTVISNLFQKVQELATFLQKINPFFEDDQELWPLMQKYINNVYQRIVKIASETLKDTFDLIEKISNTNEEILSMAWKMLFPNRRGG